MSIAPRDSLPQAEDYPPSDFFPGYCPGEPLLPPAEQIAAHAAVFRFQDTDLGDLIAEALDELARDFQSTRAKTVGEFRARKELMGHWVAQGGAR